jgi:flagellar hook-length control protein FliK
LLAQQSGAKFGKAATTGFNPAVAAESGVAIGQDAKATPDAAQTAQPGSTQTSFESEALAAAVTAAASATAKPSTKTADDAQSAKATPSVATGFQAGTAATDLTATPVTPTSSSAPPNTAPDNHKHDDGATTTAKSAAPDSGTSATQPSAPQHAAQAANSTQQPQTSQTDGSQQQGINSAVPQPQVQSAAATTPVAPQFNVAVAAGAAVPLNGLAVQIAVTAQSGKSRFEIRLDPADLGRIDVRLDVDRQGQVTSHLTVEKPETLAMLRQDAPQLQRALQDAGLKTGDGGLQFSLRDQSSQGQTARDDTGRNARHLIVTEDNVVPATTAGRSYGRILGSSSGLDIRV